MNPFDFGGSVVALFVFAFILGAIGYAIVKSLRQKAIDDASPILVVPAKIVAKRTNTWGGSGNSSASTSYYATFEFDLGDRKEFGVRGTEYGLLAEGDRGELTSQGSR